MTFVQTAKTTIDTIIGSTSATVAVSAPPALISVSGFWGIPWQPLTYAITSFYSILLIMGILWKWGSIWARWRRERKKVKLNDSPITQS